MKREKRMRDSERKKERKDEIPTKNEYQNHSNFMGLNSPFIFNDEGVRTILSEMFYTYWYLYTLSYPNFLSLRILLHSFIVCVCVVIAQLTREKELYGFV